MKATKILYAIVFFCFICGVASAQTVATNPVTVTAKQSTAFTFDDSYMAFGTDASYNWNFGDGTGNETGTSPVVMHTYTKDGTYTLTVIVTTSLTIDGWDVSPEWQQTVETYTTSVIVYPSQAAIINANIIQSIGLFAVLPAVLGAAVFLLSIRAFSNVNNESDAQAILVSLTTAIATIVLTEICVYVIVLVASVTG